MAEYIFPTFISITSLVILWLLLKPWAGISVLGCIIASILISYLILLLARLSPHYVTAILSISYLVELVILILILNSQKKKDNVKIISILYTIAIALSYLFAKDYYHSDEKQKNRFVEKNNLIKSLKEKYDFNVDSLLVFYKASQNYNDKGKSLQFPIIVYHKSNGKILFDYEFNKVLDSTLTSFYFDSLNTIVLLEDGFIELGTYTNGKTRAQKHETTISFLDKKSMKIISSTNILGGDPPRSIEYKGTAPETATGTRPSYLEIIDTIRSEFHSSGK